MVENYDFLNKPYNSVSMVYNYAENRYVLTLDGANEANLDLLLVMGKKQVVDEYLDLLSRSIYSVFLKNNDSKLRYKKLWLLSHSKNYREMIETIFKDIIWYNYRSGGFMTLYQSGINLNEMKVIELTINNAMSVISNNMAQIGGINERTLRYRISNKRYFKTLDALKIALLEVGLYTEEELENITTHTEIKQTIDYAVYKNLKEEYILEDFTLWKTELEKKNIEW